MVSRDILAKSVLFADLGEIELDEAAKLCTEREFAPQSTLCEEGEPARYLYLLQAGKVAIEMRLPATASSRPKRTTVDEVSEGEVIGWSALGEPRVYAFSATCLQKTSAVVVDGQGLKELLDRNPSTGYKVLKGLLSVVASRLTATRLLLISERAWPTTA